MHTFDERNFGGVEHAIDTFRGSNNPKSKFRKETIVGLERK